MTYQSYSKGIRLIFALLGPLYFLQQFGKAFPEYFSFPIILIVLYFAVRIAALFLLFFSIYALLAKIKNYRKLESPVILTIIGVIFVILSFGPPIVAYSITHDYKYAYERSRLDAEQVKKEAVNINNSSGKRYLMVDDYYLDTGERLPWLDDNNKVTIYTPDEKAMARFKTRQSLMESEHMLKLSLANLRITAYSLIGLLIISTFCFIGLLWYRFPRRQ